MKVKNSEAVNFILEVEKMRMYQRDYFRTRSVDSLNQARRLEREIDVAIARLKAGAVQMSLLPDEQP